MSDSVIKKPSAEPRSTLPVTRPRRAIGMSCAGRPAIRFVVDVSGPGGEAVTTDMATLVGGTGSAPSPGWLFRPAVASGERPGALRAATRDVAVEGLEATVDSQSDDRGILGFDSAVPAGPLSLRVAVSVHAPGADVEQLRGIVAGHRPRPGHRRGAPSGPDRDPGRGRAVAALVTVTPARRHASGARPSPHQPRLAPAV